MITSVRFPSAVEVIKGEDSRSTWNMGYLGITSITVMPYGGLMFRRGVNATSLVYPMPGTVVEQREDAAIPLPTVGPEPQETGTNGPASSTPSAEPARAKPIKQRR